MTKIPLNNAEESLIPGPGVSHLHQRSWARGQQLLSPRALEPGSRSYCAYVLQLLQPTCPGARALQQKSAGQACPPQPESSLFLWQLEKSPHSNEGSQQSEINTYYIFLKRKSFSHRVNWGLERRSGWLEVTHLS